MASPLSNIFGGSFPDLVPVGSRPARQTGPMRQGSVGPEVATLQKQLAAAGFNPGPIDGMFGGGVRLALENFQKANGLPATGVADPATLAKLKGAKPAAQKPPEMLTGKMSSTAAEVASAAKTDVSKFKFEKLTPTGEKLMKASHWWMDQQRQYEFFPRARMCANNVSKVFSLVGLGKYQEEGVRALTAELKTLGAQNTRMPNDKAGFIKALNDSFKGSIPAGTVISGNSVNSSAPGMQHVGFIGHTDKDGVVWIYHNNWLRPGADGQRSAHMVSAEFLRDGFPRQWMATPWIQVQKDAGGKVVDVKSMLPKLDDMDPLNKEFFVNLSVPAEIVAELGGPPVPEVKPAPKPEVKPAPKPEVKPAPKPVEVKPATPVEVKPAMPVEVKPATPVEVKPATEAKPLVELNPVPANPAPIVPSVTAPVVAVP